MDLLEDEGGSGAVGVDWMLANFRNLDSLFSQSRFLNSSHSVQMTIASASLQASSALSETLTWGLMGSEGIDP